jgi:hypothetical protein
MFFSLFWYIFELQTCGPTFIGNWDWLMISIGPSRAIPTPSGGSIKCALDANYVKYTKVIMQRTTSIHNPIKVCPLNQLAEQHRITNGFGRSLLSYELFFCIQKMLFQKILVYLVIIPKHSGVFSHNLRPTM